MKPTRMARRRRAVLKDVPAVSIAFAVMRHCVVLAGLVVAASPTCADWPQFRGDPAHTASSRGTKGSLLLPLWTRQLPSITIGSTTYAPDITSSPAIVGDTVYIGSGNTHLYALDAGTGGIRWEYPAGDAIRSSPLVANGRVIFTSVNGDMVALDLVGGTKVWSGNSGGLQDRASPTIAADVIVAGATFPRRRIYSLPVTGPPEAWHVDTGQPVFSSAAVDTSTQVLYCGSNDGKLYALHADGSAAWASPVPTDGGIYMASPTLANGRLYLSAGDFDFALHAWDAATGGPIWSAPMTPVPALPPRVQALVTVSSPAVDGTFIAVVGGYGSEFGPSLLFAFRDNGATATRLWATELPNRVTDSYVSSPALTGTSVIVGVAAALDAVHPAYPQGRLYVVDRATGAARWYAVGDPASGINGGPVLSSPAVSGDLVVIGDRSGLVTAYRLLVPGDADGNGRVELVDAVLLARVYGGIDPPSVPLVSVGDLSPVDTARVDGSRSFGDGAITASDVARVLLRVAGLETGTWP